METMSCEFDFAQAMEQREREAVIARLRSTVNAGCGSPVCLECGDDIEPARLKVMPNARHCVDCQSARERKASAPRWV
jgi:phage/conjugal plasmid C-4 type zinc finger TraR family protein